MSASTCTGVMPGLIRANARWLKPDVNVVPIPGQKAQYPSVIPLHTTCPPIIKMNARPLGIRIARNEFFRHGDFRRCSTTARSSAVIVRQNANIFILVPSTLQWGATLLLPAPVSTATPFARRAAKRWAHGYYIVNANLDYSRKLFGLDKPVRFQLNVNNLLDNDNLLPTVSDGEDDFRWRFIPPRSVSFTTTVRF